MEFSGIHPPFGNSKPKILGLEISKGCKHNFAEFPGVEVFFVWNFQSKKLKNSSGVFKKVCPQPT